MSVSVGNQFGCAINNEGLLYSWGVNFNGELATGDTEERMVPQLV